MPSFTLKHQNISLRLPKVYTGAVEPELLPIIPLFLPHSPWQSQILFLRDPQPSWKKHAQYLPGSGTIERHRCTCATKPLTHSRTLVQVQPQAHLRSCKADPKCPELRKGGSTPSNLSPLVDNFEVNLVHYLPEFPNGVVLHLATVGTCLEMQPSSLLFLAKPTSYLVFLGMANKILVFKPLSQDLLGNPN